MNETRYRRQLNLSPPEYESVLRQMNARCSRLETHNNSRRRRRHGYEITDIPLHITHPQGGTGQFLVFGRNISRTGLSVLHGGFLHPGTICVLVLRRHREPPLEVSGEVRHCRLFAGNCHEIGIHLDQEVDPAALVGTTLVQSEDGDEAEDEASARLELSGTILVAESFVPDHVLLEHYLGVFGLDIEIAETPGATLDALKRGGVDLVLFGLHLPSCGLRTIRFARDLGIRTPILVLTAETDRSLLLATREAGATAILPKPYDIESLVAEVRHHLGGCERPGPLRSTVADMPGMSPLIDRYVELVRRTVDQVERTYEQEEWSDLVAYCHQLKGSGCGYGFQDITVAAMAVLKLLEKDPLATETRTAVDMLCEYCRKITSSRTVRAAS